LRSLALVLVHHVTLKVADIERSGRFYDSILAPLGWRRQEENEQAVSWGLNRSVFFIEIGEGQGTEFGHVSFPARSIPAVRASWESGSNNGGTSVAEPGSSPLRGPGNYSARLEDPDGYLVELLVAPD
jgi:catechol 2,3-dioxygenase-like lactoylglutathione lyase family enzyme